MSEHPDPAVHPDPDTLADHAEGLLPSHQSAEVARHLLTCADCRDTRDALAEVSTLLTAYADPGPMPTDAADRLDAALAAAGPPDPTGDAPSGEAPAGAATVVPAAAIGRPTRTPFGSKVLQIAAVVVLLAALGGVGVSALMSRTSTSSTSSAGGAASDKRAASGAGAAAATLRAASGTAYTIANLGSARTLAERARDLAAPQSGTSTSATSSPPAAAPFESSLPTDQRVLSDSPQALAACVRRLLGSYVQPVAVDLGTWAGSPATVIVLPSQDDPSSLDVFAVRASCPPGDFLGFVRVPR